MVSGDDCAGFLNENKITVFSTVPTFLSSVSGEIPSLRLLILGGEVCPEQLVRPWVLSGVKVINTYGPTETTVIATWHECRPGSPVTIGRRLPNYSTYILDSHLRRVPIGVPGELCIGGPGLSKGYINLPDLTHDKFILSPFPAPSGSPALLYRTGDMCRYNSSGEIEFLERLDSQIKLRGYRIELSEIENQLLQCEGVKNAVVAVKEGFNRVPVLVAYIVPAEKGSFNPDEVKKRLTARLPRFMVPGLFEIVNHLPGLANGKINRKGLSAPKIKEQTGSGESGRKITPTEQKIRDLWEKIFTAGRIGITDNFFDLGGHSLFASVMISELRRDPDMSMLSVKDILCVPDDPGTCRTH